MKLSIIYLDLEFFLKLIILFIKFKIYINVALFTLVYNGFVIV